jgi:hypothetical protein
MWWREEQVMATFFLTFIIVTLSVAGLGLGVLFGRGRLRGTCGGLASGEDDTCACEAGQREDATS